MTSYGLLNSLLGLAVVTLPFLFVQRWLHREMQTTFLLIFRRPAVALGLFSLVFLPGVILHETSHFLMAKLLRVRTSRMSLLPTVTSNGTLRLGYVEMEKTGFVKDALIGTAPLLTGGIVTGLIGTYFLGLNTLADMALSGQRELFFVTLQTLPSQPDFWLWFYLAVVVSSIMLPSASDRRAWLPMLLMAILLVGAALLAGAGPWMMENLGPWLETGLNAVARIFVFSLVVHLALVIPFSLTSFLLSRLTPPIE